MQVTINSSHCALGSRSRGLRLSRMAVFEVLTASAGGGTSLADMGGKGQWAWGKLQNINVRAPALGTCLCETTPKFSKLKPQMA